MAAKSIFLGETRREKRSGGSYGHQSTDWSCSTSLATIILTTIFPAAPIPSILTNGYHDMKHIDLAKFEPSIYWQGLRMMDKVPGCHSSKK